MPPNRRLSGFFLRKKPALLGLFSPPVVFGHSVDLKYAKYALAAPDPTGGAHDVPPDPVVGWGGGTTLPNLHRSRRLWRLDSRVFGAQLRCPKCKILATPLQVSSTPHRRNVCLR